MNLILSPDQQKWLETQVAAGHFRTIEDAAEAAIAAAMVDEASIGHDDLEWAKRYVDQGRAEALSGDVVTHADHKARMAARWTALRG